MSDIIKFHFIRHGPVINPDQIWYGEDVEFDLTSPEIVNHLHRLAAFLPTDPKKAIWVASRYPRSHALAEAILKATGKSDLPRFMINEKFIEQQYGMMEGMRGKEARNHPDLAAYFNDMWNNAPPGGESMSMLQDRVGGEMDYLAEDMSDDIEDIVVVAHGGVNMAAFSHAIKRRMIDVFNERRLKLGPSFSYISRLELHYNRRIKEWVDVFEYETGLPKLAL